jgi:23S rRNA (cytidine1920-2'-O)/16S rRNA (cytidine1409-2'-O)-methyltransferase
MARKGRARFRALHDVVARAFPALDATDAIRRGAIRVDGRIVTNPNSLVAAHAAVTVKQLCEELRGEAKLQAAVDAFALDLADTICVDLGAAAGGFTRVLLRAGARRVYAVDAGVGQLRGYLRQHPAVVNLERTNLADLDPTLIPDDVDVVTADLSYLSLARALPQLEGRLRLSPDACLVALVKPQFELGLGVVPTAPRELRAAQASAVRGATAAGWIVEGVIESPVRGSRGAIEFLLAATAAAATRRRGTPGTPRRTRGSR